MRVSDYVIEEDAQIKAATDLVTREVTNKKAANVAALQQALAIASEIEVPVEALLKKSTAEDAQKVVELAGNLQELVVAEELLKAAEEVQREDVGCSEAGTS